MSLRPIACSLGLGLVLSVLVTGGVARADDEVLARLSTDTGIAYSYAEYLPPGYDAEGDAVTHPLIVFLHGQGELSPAASDGTTVINQVSANGPFQMLRRGDRTFADADAIVVGPLGHREDGWWSDGKLREFMAYVVARYRVDWRRVYVTGISMGGGGTFAVGNAHGARVAAYVPICPAGEANGTSYVDVPLWGFHSIDDGTVNIGSTWTSMDRIADARAGRDVAGPSSTYPRDGADHTAIFDPAAGTFSWVPGRDASGDSPLRATIYPDGSHNSWSRTYDDPAVWTWVFAQRRPIPDGLPAETVFVDALSAGVIRTGTWSRTDGSPGFFFWDTATAPADGSAEITFPLRASEDGRYEIFVREVVIAGAASRAIVIDHDGGEETTALAPPATGGAFVSIAEVPLRAGDTSALTVRAMAGASGTLVADAIALVRRGPLAAEDAGVIIDVDAAGIDAAGIDAGPRPDGGAGRDGSVIGADGGTDPAGLRGSCACGVASRPRRSTYSSMLAAMIVLAAIGRRVRRTGARAEGPHPAS